LDIFITRKVFGFSGGRISGDKVNYNIAPGIFFCQFIRNRYLTFEQRQPSRADSREMLSPPRELKTTSCPKLTLEKTSVKIKTANKFLMFFIYL
jgi:hypothetical protein